VTAIKCVVWDLDGTVWPEIAIERAGAGLPQPSADVLATMDLLEQRGIVNCVASRTDPSLLDQLTKQPDLRERIVVWRVNWADKGSSLFDIAAELGIGIEALAFVDDSGYERAEVASSQPLVTVLSPAELRQQIDTEAFRPAVLTDDARQRPRRYREHAKRVAAEASAAKASAAGSASAPAGGPARTTDGTIGGTIDSASANRATFLRESEMQLVITPAEAGASERMSELIARSHRLNSTGEAWTAAQLRAILDDPDWTVATASLTDRFGDYGLIGVLLIHHEAGAAWRLRSLTVSCRAAGRGVPTALIAWAISRASAQGADELVVDIVAQPANLELRVLLRSAGFGAALDGAHAAPHNGFVLTRATSQPVEVPDWLTVHAPDPGAAHE
jgi:methoxymalonate biosynthesis protein